MYFGPGGGMRFAQSAGRSLQANGLGSIRYPSPFFDIAHMYLPTSFKAMLKWCRYYFLTNPLINSVIYKMAEYPVTDLIFDSSNESLVKKWRYFFDNVIQLKKFQIEAGLDYGTYGNCFVSIFYPFLKHLQCKRCRRLLDIRKTKYTFRSFKFHGTCPHCGNYGAFDVRDIYIKSVRDIRLIRWNPEYVTILHNDATGESEYYYRVPPQLANDIRMGKKHIIEKVPQIFIDAMEDNKSLKFSRDNLFHMKRPTIAQKDKGWGLPMALPVLKDVFYLQILRKAQEAIGIEHIVPLRILFPQTSSASADVYGTVNLTQWRHKAEREITRWRLDNNYIPIMPLPMGQQTLGGDGRALSLSQEYRVWAEHIIAGMGVPQEFVFGGLSYSGSNVSMRMLENHFIEDRSNHLKMVTNFIMPNVAAFMEWETVDCHFRRFKMADDLQRGVFHLQLAQAQKLSDKSLLEDLDWDSGQEALRIQEEQKRLLEAQRNQALAQANIQGESQMVMARYQMKSQNTMMAMQPQAAAPPQQVGPAQPEAGPMAGAGGGMPQGQLPPGQPGQEQGQPAAPGPMEQMGSPLGAEQQGGGQDLLQLAEKVVSFLDQMPEHEQQGYLAQMQQQNPQLAALVMQLMQQRGGAHKSSASKPLPEQRPPRRGPEAAIV